MKSLAPKRLARAAVRSARTWLKEPPQDPITAERERFKRFAYGKLNALLIEIMSKTDGTYRANYTWGLLHAAYLAKAVGLQKMSAIEFGVAGGLGLLSMEKSAAHVEKALGVEIEVHGFDTGRGLPKPIDYRDLPNLYEESTYMMDRPALERRLQRAKLWIGLISETLPSFMTSSPAPVGFAAIDVDLYSSTVDVLKLFEADPSLLLPRVHCYFDDIMGATCAEFNGERLAIAEFNQANSLRKLSPIYGLRYFVPRRMSDDIWTEMTYLAHILDHPLYGVDDGMVTSKQERL